VVLDIDGVLVVGRRPVAGAGTLLHYLGEARIPFGVLTNDGNNSVEQKAALLEAAGLPVPPGTVTSSGHVLRDVAADLGLRGRRCFVAGRLGEPCYAEAAGIRVTRRLEELVECAGVILGEEEFDWEPVINGVINFFIVHPEAPLIVPNPDLYFPAGGGRVRVASGAVAALIRLVLRRHGVRLEPLLLGKPHRPIFLHGHRRLEERAGRVLPRRRVLMVGDSLGSDIRGALRFRYRSALLLTGATTAVALASSRIRPELVFERIG
jgi:HAD superfamily hydrolase (TIGR01450 family)